MHVIQVHTCVTACGAVATQSRGQRAASPRAPQSPHVRPRARASTRTRPSPRGRGPQPARAEQRAGRASARGPGARCCASRPQTPPQKPAACQGDLMGVINPFLLLTVMSSREAAVRCAGRREPHPLAAPLRGELWFQMPSLAHRTPSQWIRVCAFYGIV